MSGYNMDAGRTDDQIAKMKRLSEEGLCAFCPENLEEFHDNPIDFATEHWSVTKNDYPYEHTSVHVLLIPHEHATTVSELSVAARADMLEAIARAEKHYGLRSYGVAMRSGDMRYNGGSVEHLHAHIIVGDFSDPANHHKVRFKFSSVPVN